MSRKNVNFGDKKVKESDFYKNKKVTLLDDINVNKILVSKEEPYGAKNSIKYFIGYNHNDVIRPFWINLQQISGYVRKCKGDTTIPFKIKNKELLKTYNQIWKRVQKLLKIEFDSEFVYGGNDKYIRTKTKIYAGSMITNFRSKICKKKKNHASVYQ